MPDKFIRQGATFNGDGTTSALATSNGGVGAWNNINVFQGTTPAFGTLGAGDTVYIRSKDEAGADIYTTQSSNITLGAAAATANGPVTWVHDAGTVWPGIAGTLTYHRASTSFTLVVRAYNRVICEAPRSIDATINAGFNGHVILVLAGGAVIDGFSLRDLTGTGSSNGPNFLAIQASNYTAQAASAYRCFFSTSDRWGSIGSCSGFGTMLELIDCEWELNSVDSGGVVSAGSNGFLSVVGGRMRGVGADNGSALVVTPGSTSSIRVEVIGLSFPQAMPIISPDPGAGNFFEVSGVAADGGWGAFSATRSGTIDSRSDGFYPVLNAEYPGSPEVSWSWRITPFAQLSNEKPLSLRIAKAFYGTAAAQTLTLELLSHTAWSNVNKGSVWMNVTYTDDSTGLPRSVSTMVPGATSALDASTANWSSTSWGAVGLTKHKLVVTTPTAVKQNTPVMANLRFGAARQSSTNYVFICPDITMVAA